MNHILSGFLPELRPGPETASSNSPNVQDSLDYSLRKEQDKFQLSLVNFVINIEPRPHNTETGLDFETSQPRDPTK
jgi:hypothetical protein